MSDTNVFVCTGRLGGDVKVMTFQDGNKVANFNLAIGEQWKNRDGEKQERTLWLPVSIQNQGIAKVAEQYLKKGSRVSISGKLQSREYEKDGQKHTIIELVISPFGGTLTMLDGPSGDIRQQQQVRSQSGSKAPAFEAGGFEAGGLDDDIPF